MNYCLRLCKTILCSIFVTWNGPSCVSSTPKWNTFFKSKHYIRLWKVPGILLLCAL